MKPVLIRISEFGDPNITTGPSPIDPIGYKISEGENYDLYHFIDEYTSACEDVVGKNDLNAVLVNYNTDRSEALVDDTVVECTVDRLFGFTSKYQIFCFGRQWDSVDGYSLEVRGLTSESIFGGWDGNVRTAYLFGENISPTLEDDGVFRFDPNFTDINDYKVYSEVSDAAKGLAPWSDTEVLRVDFEDRSEYEQFIDEVDSPIRIS